MSDRVSPPHRFEFLQNRLFHLLASHCLLLLILPYDGFVPCPIQLNQHYLEEINNFMRSAVGNVSLPADIRIWHPPDMKQDYLFIYLHSTLSSNVTNNHVYFCLFSWRYNPLWLYFSQPGSGLWPPRVRGFLITHNDAPHLVGLLWTSDQSVAETST